MSNQVPSLFRGFVDDAAVFPPGSAPLPDALVAHRRHRQAWYANLIGPLLVPASALPRLTALLEPEEHLDIGVIGDTGVGGLDAATATAEGVHVRQVEVAVAKRGEDPQPGLVALVARLTHDPFPGYAEIPLSWGLLAALDSVAEARAAGVPITPKFRTGGLAAELFPSPAELAAVICACRDRELPFKLTAGLHRAIRYGDRETSFVHHGFLNILAGTFAAAVGASIPEVTALLATTDATPIVDVARRNLGADRPLWIGFGTCDIDEPLADLVRFGLVGSGE